MKKGYENAIKFEKDKRTVVKSYERKDSWNTEKTVLQSLAHLNFVPKVLQTTDMQVRIQYIEGTHPEGHHLEDSEFIKKLAYIISSVHMSSASENVGPYLHCQNLRDVSWKDYIVKKTKMRLSQIVSVEIQEKPLLEALMSLPSLKSTSLLHHDLKSANIIYTPDSQVYLIDWEKASFGDALLDIAKLKWRMFGKNRTLWEQFIQTYLKQLSIHPSLDIQNRIETYENLHLIGAIAYYETTLNLGYKKHFIDACSRLKERGLL